MAGCRLAMCTAACSNSSGSMVWPCRPFVCRLWFRNPRAKLFQIPCFPAKRGRACRCRAFEQEVHTRSHSPPPQGLQTIREGCADERNPRERLVPPLLGAGLLRTSPEGPCIFPNHRLSHPRPCLPGRTFWAARLLSESTTRVHSMSASI